MKPSPKTDRHFTFLSKDEVEKLHQEEEKKIATLKRDKKSTGQSGEEYDDSTDTR